VATREELEALPTPELYDRATKRARHHADVRFLWRLLQALPAAEASAGHLDEAESDVQSIYGHLNDLKMAREGEVADELRPIYIDYLAQHSGD
jgi:uncharacterized membrane protein YebE (DUF533 family)